MTITGVFAPDGTPPRIRSIARLSPSSSPTDADTVSWRWTFTEPVISVEASDFTVTGTTATLSVSNDGAGVIDLTLTGGDLADLNGIVAVTIDSSTQNITDLSLNELSDLNPIGDNVDSIEVENLTVPDAPTNATATAGDTTASLSFDVPGDDGGSAITGYKATSTPGDVAGFACAGSPCTVTGLTNGTEYTTNGTEYTFTVAATNAKGDSLPSNASNAVTPLNDTDGDGVADDEDAFPNDPVETLDSDNDGIGENGDAGGTGIGVVLRTRAYSMGRYRPSRSPGRAPRVRQLRYS
ncbi:MAG: fibronectin type III domain-containing protein [Lacipirellulaceae bacterium]